MILPSNPFTHALHDGRKQIGLWLSLSDGFAAQAVAQSGFDWLLLDMEHSPNDLQNVMAQLEALKDSTATAIVRPDWNDTVKVKRLLDMGAPGLLFPMIQTVAEAEQAVAATRYPPRGVRGVGATTRANGFGRYSDYFDRVEDETTVLLQIETRSALALATDIAAVDGVSGIFFGPADIAADMGLLGQPLHPDVWEAIMPVAKALMARGMPVGTLVPDPAVAAQLLKDGFTFVACGSDLGLLVKSADALNARMRVAIT
jgi:4-hydroxy-2-oxoheptanedioate aldolase